MNPMAVTPPPATVAATSTLLFGLMFASGATVAIPVTFVGKFGVGELLSGVAALSLIASGRLPRLNALHSVWTFAGIGLLGLVVSAQLNGVARIDTLRSLANHGLVWVNLTCLFAVFRHDIALAIPYAAGKCVSLITQRYTDPDLTRAFSDYYQTVVLPVVVGVLLLMVIVFFYKNRTVTAACLLGLATTSILCDSRSGFLVACIATILYMRTHPQLRALGERFGSGFHGRHLAWVLMGGAVAFIALVELSERGYLGTQRQMQVLRLNQKYNPFEYIIRSGRGAIASSYVAIRDRPFLGHGPRADGRRVILQTRQEFGVTFSQSELAKYDWVIPSHSVILGSWVDGGVLAVVPWGYVTYLLVRCGIKRSRPPERVRAWYLFYLASCLWAIGLSPLSYTLRQTLPAILAISLATLPAPSLSQKPS